MMVEKINRLCIDICRVVYLNILWLIFTTLGGILFGIFPATVALFSVFHQLLKSEDSLKYHKVFFDSYKNNFLIANLSGFIFIIAGFILYFYYHFSAMLVVSTSVIIFDAIVNISILIYIMTLTFFFPVFVHYELKGTKIFLQPFLVMLFSPMQVLITITIIFLVGLLYFTLPGLSLFFGISLPASVIMQIMYKRFLKLSSQINDNSVQ